MIFGDSLETSTGQVRINCPGFCEKAGKSTDEGYHFYISTKNNKYICHRCGTRGPNIHDLFPTFAYYYDTEILLDFAIFDPDTKKISFDLNLFSEPVEDYHFEYLYLRNKRHLSDEDIKTFDLRRGIGDFEGSVIIPLKDLDGKTIFYLRRSLDSRSGLRYIDPVGATKIGVLGNYDQCFNSKTTWVYLTEGWFTGKALGPNFVCTLGKYIHHSQAYKIAAFKDIFYCPDSDVSAAEIRKNILTLLDYTDHVYYLQVPRDRKCDADDLTYNEKCHMISQPFHITRFNIGDVEKYVEKSIYS